MTTTITPTGVARVPLEVIDAGINIRELNEAHVAALADSIALRGLLVPLIVRPAGERFELVAGHHRLAACRKLDLRHVEVTVREQDATSADSAAENILRQNLTPLGEARAVGQMLGDGLTLDGAAAALGWARQLVSARAKILKLPEPAQALLDTGELPVGAVETLLNIAAVSPELCDAAIATVADGHTSGAQLARDPSWAISQAVRSGRSKAFAAFLNTVNAHEIAELRLAKKPQAAFEEATALHRGLDRYAYGPPAIRFAEADVDQARAAGVLIELERGAPIICDRSLYRELVKQAIARTVDELRAAVQARDAERAERRRQGQRERTPAEELEAEHRATVRELTARAHNTNLDLGRSLLDRLAVVDAANMDVARFFAYGVLGPDTRSYLGTDDHTARTIAANGIRLVLDEQRNTTTPTLQNGQPGKTKVTYGAVEDATAWLWKFVDAAKTAGELYGRVLVVFACQHYAQQLVLARSQRRSSALPSSHKDLARKAFERVTKDALPASHTQLIRALECGARAHKERLAELEADATRASEQQGADIDEDLEDERGVDEDLDD